MGVSCMRHALGHNYSNSSCIADVAIGQIPRSTERISSSPLQYRGQWVPHAWSSSCTCKTAITERVVRTSNNTHRCVEVGACWRRRWADSHMDTTKGNVDSRHIAQGGGVLFRKIKSLLIIDISMVLH